MDTINKPSIIKDIELKITPCSNKVIVYSLIIYKICLLLVMLIIFNKIQRFISIVISLSSHKIAPGPNVVNNSQNCKNFISILKGLKILLY